MMRLLVNKSKAAILVKQKKPLVIDEIKMPNELLRGQVLVKLIYSGICGSQIGEIEGVKGPDKFLPHLLGHEGIGKVLQIGQDVKKVKKNDIVLMHWMKSNGINSQTPKYTWKNKPLNAGYLTTFNNHAVVSENRLTRINKKKNLKNQLLLGCTASTSLGTIFNLGKIKRNNRIVVSGCGPIGLYIIKYLKFIGIKDIFSIDISKNKLNISKKIGAKKSFLNTYKNKIFDTKDLKNIDYFFECSGNINVIEKAFQNIKTTGTLILVGVPPFRKKIKLNSLEIILGKKIIGSKGGGFNANKDFKKFSKIILSKLPNYNDLITQEIKLNNINKTISKIKNNQIAGKVIINFK